MSIEIDEEKTFQKIIETFEKSDLEFQQYVLADIIKVVDEDKVKLADMKKKRHESLKYDWMSIEIFELSIKIRKYQRLIDEFDKIIKEEINVQENKQKSENS